jgi:hypothetical protein
MSFIWPVMLVLLVLIPLSGVLYILLQQRRRRFAASYGSLGLVQEAAGRELGSFCSHLRSSSSPWRGRRPWSACPVSKAPSSSRSTFPVAWRLTI